MIRKFQQGDLERVAEIWLEANIQAHNFISGRYWEGQLEMVKVMLPQAELFVAQGGDGEIQGFIGLNGDHVEGLFVRPPFQSRGLGRELLDRAKTARGRLTLNVYQKNERAAAFYRREGFRVREEGMDASTGEPEYGMVWEEGRTC